MHKSPGPVGTGPPPPSPSPHLLLPGLSPSPTLLSRSRSLPFPVPQTDPLSGYLSPWLAYAIRNNKPFLYLSLAFFSLSISGPFSLLRLPYPRVLFCCLFATSVAPARLPALPHAPVWGTVCRAAWLPLSNEALALSLTGV